MGSLRRILLVLLFFFALSGILCAADDFCFFGVFPGWGEFEDDVSTDALVNFERLVGKRVAVVPFSVFFGQGASKVPGNLEAIASYGAVPLVRLMPWGPPYWVPEYQERYSLLRIARGEHDALLREVAEAVRDFGELTVVTFGVEMNGDWFPWSGVFQGGAQEGPENFRRAFRHVVEVFREAGAANVLWLFQVNHESHPDESWNAPANYYPGDDYVDIVGFSLYGKQFVDEPWMSFGELMERAYPVVSRIAPEKPLILAEWGVGEWPDGDKAAWYEEALALLKDRYPLIRAAIVYHDRW
ncbi:MAG: beta-mannanase, partial [Thermodesulfobacteria bacterium]|nr:beta-mannanase [Thermodesulfobacteriota bacterium]